MKFSKIGMLLIVCAGVALVTLADSLSTATAEEPSPQPNSRLVYAAIIRPGPNWKPGLKPSEQEGFAEHFATLRGLREDGTLMFAGPFQDGRGGGLTIVRANSLKEATTIIERDPFVQTKKVEADIRPWFAAMGDLPRRASK